MSLLSDAPSQSLEMSCLPICQHNTANALQQVHTTKAAREEGRRHGCVQVEAVIEMRSFFLAVKPYFTR